VVRARPRFHRDPARGHGGQHLEQLLAPHGARQHHRADLIHTVHGEHVLG
jgi:hypothetical protein